MRINWSFVTWGAFIGVLAFCGAVVAPGCTDTEIKVTPVVETNPSGTPEFLEWWDKQKVKCADRQGSLEYNIRFRLAICSKMVDGTMAITYSSRWDGITKN